MTDRPIAAVLAVVAAAMFLATFSAAAVLRSDAPAVAGDTTVSAPAAATQETTLATIAPPSLSRVAALPALHLPKPKPKPKHKKKAATKAATAPRVASTPPAATATPTAPTYTPPAQSSPPRRKSSSSKTFDTSG